MDQGSVFKRCGCRDQLSGRLLGAGCARLRGPGHGSWYFSAELPSGGDERRRVRRGGFGSRAAAAAALKALAGPRDGRAARMSTGEWLERWLASRVSLRASTRHGYAAHVRGYLIPCLGAVPIADLAQGDVQGMFTAIAGCHKAAGRPVSAATLQRIHATLRAALNAAVRAGLIASNPGRWVELPVPIRPRPQVWTPALTVAWKDDGSRPAVGVWTPAQTAAFLASVRDERLYALFHLVALRGLRRGEAAGLRWADLHLEAATLAISRQLQHLGGHLVTGPPKSQAGQRVIALDRTNRGRLARAPSAAARRARRRRGQLAGKRVRVHCPVRGAGAAGLADPPLPPPGHRIRVAASDLAWPPARRGHSRPCRRYPDEGDPGPARAFHNHADRRHLHLRAPRSRPHRSRGRRQAPVPGPPPPAARKTRPPPSQTGTRLRADTPRSSRRLTPRRALRADDGAAHGYGGSIRPGRHLPARGRYAGAAITTRWQQSQPAAVTRQRHPMATTVRICHPG